ncbi:MAG: tetratricopeptide repeat protein, partial [Wolinella sp.]
NEKDELYLGACTNLGLLYGKGGYGVPQDSKKALKFFTLACDKGNATACQNLGSMYYNGKGVPQDWVKGAGYFKRACDAGVWVACSNFALYHYDSGNQSKAAQYFEKACELGRNDYSAQNDPEDRKIWQNACNMSDILN